MSVAIFLCSGSRTARRGLTFVEVIIGMAISSILMLALATFAISVSTGWKHSETEFKSRSATIRTAGQMEDALANMLCIVQVQVGDTNSGSAYFFCWQNDAYGGAADGKAQFGEMALVEYEPASKAVWLYKVKDESSLSALEKLSASNESWGDYTSPSIVSYFKSSSIVAPRTPLVGGYSTASVNGINVGSARFGVYASNNGKPVANYALTLGDATAPGMAYGSVPLRAAAKPTNLQ